MLIPDVASKNDFVMSELLKWLRQIKTGFDSGFSGNASEVLLAYQRMTTQAARSLGFMFSAEDIEKLVLTRRHWLLVSMVVADNGPVVHELIRTEGVDRARFLESTIDDFPKIDSAWSGWTKTLVAADTNAFVYQEPFFDKIGWPAMFNTSDIRKMVPISVVRAIDKHKDSQRNALVAEGSKETVRIRAARTSRRLRELMRDPTKVGKLDSGSKSN